MDMDQANSNCKLDFINVKGVVSSILTCYQSDDREHVQHFKESSKSSSWKTCFENELLILVIPGNPGVIEFYQSFIDHLFMALDKAVAISGLSHAGHVKPPVAQSAGSICFDLESQIHHHINFIDTYIPKTTKLVLIGHSIGAQIVLKIMKKIEHQVVKGILLFPTIERMSITPNGEVVGFRIRYFGKMLVLISRLVSSLPVWILESLVRMYFSRRKNVPECIIRGVKSLLHPSCLESCFHMALNEFETVIEADAACISNNISKLIFYYGSQDNWAPVSYAENMRKTFPKADIRICENNFQHAFVISDSKDVAYMVSEWMDGLFH